MARKHFDLTIEHLREILSYSLEKGEFRWAKPAGTKSYLIGTIAGSFSKANGYIHFRIGGKTYPAHRLAWFYVMGYMPDGFIDHIDGNKTNNKIENLRVVSNKVNCENRKMAQVDNKLGVLGVCASGKRFCATIKHHGKKIWIGTYDTPEEAHKAYLIRKREIHAGNTL